MKKESIDETWNQLEDTSCILIQDKKIFQNLIQITVLFILDQDIAPGGYGWVFPKRDNKVNIGLVLKKHS